MGKNTRYRIGQFDCYPEDLVDILVWNYKNKVWCEDGLTFEYIKPKGSSTDCLYAWKERDLIVYMFSHHDSGSQKSVDKRQIVKLVLTEQFISEIGETMGLKELWQVLFFVSLYNVHVNRIIDNCVCCKLLKRHRHGFKIASVVTFEDEGVRTLVSFCPFRKSASLSNKKCEHKENKVSADLTVDVIGDRVPAEVVQILSQNSDALYCENDIPFLKFKKRNFVMLYQIKNNVDNSLESGSHIICYVGKLTHYHGQIKNVQIKKANITSHFIDKLRERFKKMSLEDCFEWMCRCNMWFAEKRDADHLKYENLNVIVHESSHQIRTFVTIYPISKWSRKHHKQKK